MVYRKRNLSRWKALHHLWAPNKTQTSYNWLSIQWKKTVSTQGSWIWLNEKQLMKDISSRRFSRNHQVFCFTWIFSSPIKKFRQILEKLFTMKIFSTSSKCDQSFQPEHRDTDYFSLSTEKPQKKLIGGSGKLENSESEGVRSNLSSTGVWGQPTITLVSKKVFLLTKPWIAQASG